MEIYLQLSTDKLSHDGFLPRIILDKAIVEQTQQFYANKCKEIMDQTTLIDYLKVAKQHHEEEKKRIEQILTWDVGSQVLKVYRQEMLIKP